MSRIPETGRAQDSVQAFLYERQIFQARGLFPNSLMLGDETAPQKLVTRESQVQSKATCELRIRRQLSCVIQKEIDGDRSSVNRIARNVKASLLMTNYHPRHQQVLQETRWSTQGYGSFGGDCISS